MTRSSPFYSRLGVFMGCRGGVNAEVRAGEREKERGNDTKTFVPRGAERSQEQKTHALT